MPNSFESNFTRKVLMKVADRFEADRVLSKNVDTQLFKGTFDPNSGDNVDIKRPTDYNAVRTSSGDITGQKQDIITGKATATVQDYITVAVDYNEADEALKMGTDINRFWDDIAQRIVTTLETDFASYMMKNSALVSGTVGEGVDSWSEIAYAGALMESSGVQKNQKWCYALNPFSQAALSVEQRSLGVNPEVADASKMATVTDNYAGFRVMTSITQDTYTTGSGADRAGALSATPTATYESVKDSMKQSLAVTGFQANLEVKAGESITITASNRINLATRKLMVDQTGSQIPFTAVVAQDVTLNGSGAGTIVISGPAIFEAAGAYNTVDRAIQSGDVVTLGGSQNSVVQPNLFWHPQAFSIASVDMKKLHSTDTIYTSHDGLQLRCSKYSNGDANSQTVRFDLRPAYATINPFMAGHGFGTA